MWGRASSGIVLAAIAAAAISACGGSGSSHSTSSSGGNGIESKSPDQILAAAAQAARAARSLHVAGTVQNGSQTLGIDLSIRSGNGASGTISEGGASFKLVDAGDAVYIQPNDRFLAKFVHSAAAAQLLRGKWLKGSPTGSAFQGFAQLTSINKLMGALTKDHGTMTKGATTTVGGVKAVALHSSKGGTMYVAATGKPYPLRIAKTAGTKLGTVTFSRYDQPFSLKAPSKSVDIDQLQSGG